MRPCLQIAEPPHSLQRTRRRLWMQIAEPPVIRISEQHHHQGGGRGTYRDLKEPGREAQRTAVFTLDAATAMHTNARALAVLAAVFLPTPRQSKRDRLDHVPCSARLSSNERFYIVHGFPCSRVVTCCPCSQMPEPPQSLQRLRRFLCSQMPGPPQSLHWFLIRLCSQMPVRMCANTKGAWAPWSIGWKRTDHLIVRPQVRVKHKSGSAAWKARHKSTHVWLSWRLACVTMHPHFPRCPERAQTCAAAVSAQAPLPIMVADAGAVAVLALAPLAVVLALLDDALHRQRLLAILGHECSRRGRVLQPQELLRGRGRNGGRHHHGWIGHHARHLHAHRSRYRRSHVVHPSPFLPKRS